jgi:hypothetical protein
MPKQAEQAPVTQQAMAAAAQVMAAQAKAHLNNLVSISPKLKNTPSGVFF